MYGRALYSLFMLLGLAIFLAVHQHMPKPLAVRRIPGWKRAWLGLAAFVGGSLGAKIPFVVGAAGGVLSLESWVSDGKTLVAGLIGAYLLVELAKWVLEVHVKTGDTLALPLALALAVGRLGCFFNGCCFGKPTELPWGVTFLVNGQPTVCHPTQLYESLFHLTMAGVLLLLLWRGWLPTHHMQLYLIAYGVFRFATEFVRPEPHWWLGLTFYQWASLVLVAGLTGQWWWETRTPVSAIRCASAKESDPLLRSNRPDKSRGASA